MSSPTCGPGIPTTRRAPTPDGGSEPGVLPNQVDGLHIVARRGLQHQFERARRYQAALEAGEFSSLEELGRNEGLTGGRVAQLLNLLHLAPEIIAVVDVPAEACPAGVSEKKLRAIARLQDLDEQVWAFRSLQTAAGA